MIDRTSYTILLHKNNIIVSLNLGTSYTHTSMVIDDSIFEHLS